MVFVTGGTGLIGSHLLVELVQQHDVVTAIYRNSAKIKNVKKCFDYYFQEKSNHFFDRIHWKECDILDIPLLEEAMAGHKVVYHCAGFVSFHNRDFSQLMQINRYGTANIVNVALALEIEQLCYVSSTSAVGNKDIPNHEEVDENGKWVLTDETSAYSVSKYSAEKEVWRGINEGLKAVIVNPSIVIGAGSWKESSLKIFNTINKGLKFYPPGANAFVDARDVAKIMVELIDKKIENERFLCVAENLKFKELFDLIAQELHKKPPKIKVSRFLMTFTWMIASFWAAVRFSKAFITKDTVRSAFNTTKYSNKKVKKAINYEFYSIEDTIKNAVKGKIN